jgi:hypothetical protein
VALEPQLKLRPEILLRGVQRTCTRTAHCVLQCHDRMMCRPATHPAAVDITAIGPPHNPAEPELWVVLSVMGLAREQIADKPATPGHATRRRAVRLAAVQYPARLRAQPSTRPST